MRKVSDTDYIGKYIGKKIREFMTDRDVTLAEVAQRTWVTSPTLSTFLSGKTPSTNLNRYEKVAFAAWMSKQKFESIVSEARQSEIEKSGTMPTEITEDFALKSLIWNNPEAQAEAKSVIQYIKQKYGLK